MLARGVNRKLPRARSGIPKPFPPSASGWRDRRLIVRVSQRFCYPRGIPLGVASVHARRHHPSLRRHLASLLGQDGRLWSFEAATPSNREYKGGEVARVGGLEFQSGTREAARRIKCSKAEDRNGRLPNRSEASPSELRPKRDLGNDVQCFGHL